MRLLFLALIFSTFAFSLQDTMCTVPTGYSRVLNTDITILDYTDSRSCNTFTGTKYNCYGYSDKEYINENLGTLPSGLCTYHLIEKSYRYIKDCGNDAIENPNTHICECTVSSMNYDETSNSCSCPSGQVYNGDFCEASCTPLSSPYQVSSFSLESECTQSNLQTLYNQNNTDGRTITDAKWHCDNKCYFTIDSISVDINSTDNNSSSNDTTSTGSTTNTSTDNNTSNNNSISNDGSILAAVNNSNVHLSQVNVNLGTISGRVKAAGDINHAETKYQGDRLHDDLNNLRISNNNNHVNLMNSVGNIETNLGYMHNQLGTVIDELRNNNSNSSSGDANSSNDFDDSRIVEANNNTTRSINNLNTMHQGEAEADTSFFDTYQSYYDDMTQSIDSVANNVNDLMATIEGDYTPNFQSHNSCVVIFPVYGQSIDVNLCKYSPMLRPFITFILTISMLILLIRLHFYLFPKVMKSD